jgi:DNA primase
VKRAIATCGTALTEEHVRVMKRYASNVVLAFDADGAGQGAAARFYEWEQKYQMRVSVARFPKGKDPGDLSLTDPDALREAVDKAVPFLKFRLDRVLGSRPLRSNEDRVGAARDAMAVVNEHPNVDIRKLYAIEVAGHVGLPENDVVKAAVTRSSRPDIKVAPQRRVGTAENAEFVAVSMLLQRWNDIAAWLIESLFADDTVRRAFLALADAGGDLNAALELADPEAREVLERAAVADHDADPFVEACNLIGAAVRRELRHPIDITDVEAMKVHREAKLALEGLDDLATAPEAATLLLGWLAGRNEERV